MGCGKSSFGRRLAQCWDLPFYETDEMIERLVGNSVSQIFTNLGEDTFRKYEYEILHSLELSSPSIVATGGGMPCFNDNAEWMRTNGYTIYLSLSARELTDRLKRSHTTRPLLQKKRGEELFQYITELLATRETIYRRAHLSLDALHASPEVLEQIFNLGLIA